MNSDLLFQLIVLVFSIMVHEIAHGAIALRLGDDTAQKLGRLTLNPLKHIDPVGSVLLPLLLIIINSPFLVGWAKPVPYDPRRLKDPRTGAALIALAGPLSNIALALIFGLLLRLPLDGQLVELFLMIILLNLFLAVFNLVPIPPLDGSKLLYYFIPHRYASFQLTLEQFGPFILLLFLVSGAFGLIYPVVQFLFHLIVPV